MNARRNRSRACEWGPAEVLHAARLVASAVLALEPELGWSATWRACNELAQVGVGVVSALREHVGEESALAAAEAALDALAAVPDQH